ncbi:MAG: polysaccharide deacetylase family protein [Pseudomonadota bacterium]
MRVLLVMAILFAHFAFADAVSDLDRLIKSANQTETYTEYRSQFGTNQLSEKLSDLVIKHTVQEICSALLSLSYRDRVLFANAVEAISPSSQCLRNWLNAVERQTLLIQGRLITKVRLQSDSNLDPKIGRRKLGPSEDRFLPEAEAQNLPWDDPLPEGTFAFTFDDGPHQTRTEQILGALKNEDVQATFFVLGEQVDRRPRMVQKIRQARHSIAGHTYSHPDLSRRTFDSAVEEIEMGYDAIERAIGETWPMFRFPYGARTTELMDYLKEENVHHFFWNIDTLDWKKRDPEELLDYALEQTDKYGKGIILFHDVHAQTVAVMPAFLEALKQRNHKIVVYRSH